MSKKIIIFSDCDGTLLSNDYNFSDFTIQTTRKIFESGNILILITARTLNNLKQIAKQLHIDKFKGIIVANNGSQIYDFKTKKLIYDECLDLQLVDEIFETYHKPNSNTKNDKVNFISEECVYSFGESFNTIKWAKIMNQDFKAISSAKQIKHKITMITIITKKGTSIEEYKRHLKSIINKYGGNYKIDSYHSRIISIAPKNIDKGSAVKKVLQYLGDEQYITFGFGDSFNDLPLLSNVDYPIAMKNGINELKAIAYDITDYENNEDGVCRYIIDKKII